MRAPPPKNPVRRQQSFSGVHHSNREYFRRHFSSASLVRPIDEEPDRLNKYQSHNVPTILIIILILISCTGAVYYLSPFVPYRTLCPTITRHINATVQTLQCLMADFSWLLLPMAGGSLVTATSFSVIYYDSHIPGHVPPLPWAGQGFHSNYLLAFMNGVLIFLYLLFVKLKLVEDYLPSVP